MDWLASNWQWLIGLYMLKWLINEVSLSRDQAAAAAHELRKIREAVEALKDDADERRTTLPPALYSPKSGEAA